MWPAIDTLNLSGPAYRMLAPERQAAVLDTLLGYAAFLKQTVDESGLAEQERQLLQHRLALGKTLDLRTGVEGDDHAHEVSLGVSWYF